MLFSIATAEEVRFWNIEAGNAIDKLKQFSIQGNVQIMFSDDAVKGGKTNAVKGYYTPPEALQIMLKNSKLEMVVSHQKCIYAIKPRDDSPPETREHSEPQSKFRSLLSQFIDVFSRRKNAAKARSGDAWEVFYELSPFIIQSSDNNIGYYAENTLAGSRLNSKVSDLAASISVVSPQQMEDTSSVTLNDLFLYEANTEGTGNYTRYSIDKDGAVQDFAAGSSNGDSASGPFDSNRLRGIGIAETARNYFPSISRIPFDTYNASSFEINRGPNSILFGLGNAAGIVNQSLETALIGDNSIHMKFRVGSWDARRATVKVNRTLISDKLAVKLASVYNEQGFRRQPSHDISKRNYFNLKYNSSFHSTLQFYFEDYRNDNRRPNTITPRDLITPWNEAGSPTWNPLTRMVSVNGKKYGPFDTDQALPPQLWPESGYPLYYYEYSSIKRFAERRLSAEPYSVSGSSIYRTLVSGYDQQGPLWIAKGVSDASIYDWNSINIVSGNTGKDNATIIGFEIDQRILTGLFFNLGWHNEAFESTNSYYLSQQTGATLQIDPNTHLLDGSVNPFFGKPFIEVREPDDFEQWEDSNNVRAALAYEIDFSDSPGTLSWLGKHRIMGLWSEQNLDKGHFRFRQVITSNNDWVNRSDYSKGPGGAIYRRFYLGSSDGRVSQSPPIVENGNSTISLLRAKPKEGTTDTSPLSNWEWQYETVEGEVILNRFSSLNDRKTESNSIVVQNYFLNDRIITTLGWRKDHNEAQTNEIPTVNPETGRVDRSELGTRWLGKQSISGTTRSLGIVVKPTHFLSIHYNQSDNFQPANIQYNLTDGSLLPVPTGVGTDYGVTLESVDGRFYARANWSTTEQRDSRIESQFWRMGYFDAEAFYDWAALAAEYEGLTGSQAQSRIQEILKLPEGFDLYRDFSSGTSNLVSKGFELNLIYNPKSNWNIKLNVAKQHTVYTSILPEYEPWKQKRLDVWKTAHSDAMPEGYQDFWTYNNLTAPQKIRRIALIGGSATRTPELWFKTNVDSKMTIARRLEGKVVSGQRKWRGNLITNYVFDDGYLKDFGIGGSLRWEDKALIGYEAGEADPDGVVRSLDVNKPVFSEALLHFDFWCSYRFSLFQNKVGLKLQINIRDALEDGSLQAIRSNPDGSPSAFRIVDPRQFFLSAAFEF